MAVRLALAALAGVLVSVGPSAAGAAAPELAFTALVQRGGAPPTVCAGVPSDLGHARRLTGLGYADAAWADGMRVAVAGGRQVTNPIRVETAGGKKLRRVTSPRLATEGDSSPAWSPDGTKIAFSRYVFYGRHTNYRRFGIWIADVGSGRERHLTRSYAGVLAWAPTGDVIAADLGNDLGEKLELLTPDGRVTERFKLSSLGTFDRGVSWSPDGQRLAVGGGAIIDRTGTIVGRYAPPSNNGAVSSLPSWGPDGSVVFERAATVYDARTNLRFLGQTDLYLTPAGGGEPVPLTQTPLVSEEAPAWRPGSSAAPAGIAQPCLVIGSRGRDVLRGTQGEDLILGRAGDDRIDGKGGADFIVGGPGDDLLRGGRGWDVLLAGSGNDRILARDGARDLVRGGPGRDLAYVDPRLDRVDGVELVRPTAPRERAGRRARSSPRSAFIVAGATAVQRSTT